MTLHGFTLLLIMLAQAYLVLGAIRPPRSEIDFVRLAVGLTAATSLNAGVMRIWHNYMCLCEEGNWELIISNLIRFFAFVFLIRILHYAAARD